MRIICPKCNAKGYHPKINWGLAIMTLGFTALIDLAFAERNECKICEGKGFV